MHFFRNIYKLAVFLFLSLIIVIIALYTHAYLSDPIKLNSLGTYYLYDNNNELIYQGSNLSKWVNLNDMSKYITEATISVEDKNFYKHRGFDYFRIAKALFNNIKSKTIVEGASTIRQQYIKNAYLSFDKTWNRKFKEALLTLNLEMHYSKDEILEAYLNTINYGQGNYGIASAAKFYFNKDVKDLTLEESIILAGIPKSPSNYNPLTHYDNSIKRAKIVGLTMLNNNLIDNKTYNNLFNQNLDIYGKKSDDDLQMIKYFGDAVEDELKNKLNFSEELINSGNLHVFTTLDYFTQKTMEEEILNATSDDNLEVAAAIINPNDGSITALTGGMDYIKSQYNRALLSKRQVGSTMKPFLYYAALNKGMTSASTFTSQYTTFTLDNGKTYSPKNWANIYGNKDITMAAAIAYSDNTYAVKTNLFLGTDELINTAKKCGIKADLQNVVSLALGTSEINLLDFATGYASFASGGYKRDLHFIRKITDENGNELYSYKNHNDLILNPNYVYILNEILTSTTNAAFIDYNSPTALSLADMLNDKYALKTGTTDTDYWTVGYNKNFMMVMWTGYDDNRDLGISTGNNSKHIWANIATKVSNEKGYKNSWYDLPTNVIGLPLNAVDGMPSLDAAKSAMYYFLRGSEPLYSVDDYQGN